MAEISLEKLTKIYPDGTMAVEDLDLEIQDGEFMVFVGPSGCGKTTALRMVAGLEDITSGTVSIGGRIVNDAAPKDRDVAMVFQNYALYPHLSVYDNMAFSLKMRKVDKGETDRRVHEAARILGLDQLLSRKPKNLSGGQRQRVAMGRAIVREPQAFLMDEPLSNLDAKLRVETRAQIARIQDDLNVTTIYVTHDQVEAMTLGDRVAVIKKGRLQQVDASQTLYDHPNNLFVAGFIGSPAMNLVEATVARDDEGLSVGFGSVRLRLDEKIEDLRPDLRGYEGRTVILGIRPEDMYDASLQEAPPERRMRVVPDLIESLGSEALIHFTVDAPIVLTEDVRELAVDLGTDQLERLEKEQERGKSTFVAAVSPRTRAEVGQPIEIAVDTARVHAFDRETGLGIYGRG
ncbi:MAG: ABC transporter ATP-binding protein [Thermoleophilia bacterium]